MTANGMKAIARRVGAALGLMLTTLVMHPSDACAQRAKVQSPVLGPAEALSMLASGEPRALNEASAAIGAAFARDVNSSEAVVVGNYNQYTDDQREDLLDGLERIARGDRLSGDVVSNRKAIAAAHAVLLGLMHPRAATPQAYKRRIPGLLVRIYQEAQEQPAEALTVSDLGYALGERPAEASAIEEILYKVASAQPSSTSVPPQAAIEALENAGPAGVATLRRLHEQNAVRDMMARAHLAKLAENGYPVRKVWPGGRIP